jgi:hypothetical protein
VNEVEAEILSLPEPEFERFLIRLTHALTVAARQAYRPEPVYDEGSFARLRTINELIHTIGNKQLRDFPGNRLDFPRETFWTILNDVAGERGTVALAWAVEQALGRRRPQTT